MPSHTVLLIAAALAVMPAVAPGAALAQARQDTTTMRCADVQRLVSARGSVALGTGPHVYDVFVASGAHCPSNRSASYAYERTADNAQCRIGYRCDNSFDGRINEGGCSK